MDHDVTDVDLLRKRLSAFVRDRVFPCEPLLEAGGPAAGIQRERLRAEAREAGLWALPLPSELGGGGMSLSAYAALAETEGASDHGPAAVGSASLLDVTMLTRHGSPRVRTERLPGLVSGSSAPVTR